MKWSSNPIIFLTKKMWEFSKGNRQNVILFGILFLFANVLAALQPLILAWLLNTLQVEGVTSANIYKLLGIVLLFPLLSFFFWCFHGPARVLERKNAFLVRANYKKFLLKGIMGLPPQWHTDHHSGDTIDKVAKATTAMHKFSGLSFLVIEAILKLVTAYLALAYFDLPASFAVLIVLFITMGIVIRFDEKLKREYKILFKMENQISARVYDAISNISTVIILRIEKLLEKDLIRKILQPFRLYSKNAKGIEWKWFTVTMCTASLHFIVLAIYLWGNLSKGIPVMVGTVSALAAYVTRINQVAFRFADHYGEIVKQKAAVENMEAISDEFKTKEKLKQVDLNKRWKELEIRNLSFSYHNKDGGDLHLNKISLSFKRGEKVALIGESGSGKTTFLSLIRGLFQPKRVDVFVDKKHFKGGFNCIDENIALIPQEPEIFSRTIEQNITLGINHKEAYIRKFTNMAVFTKVVDNLPKGFNSYIFEKGVNLSGGEKQRLALSRGLLAAVDKPILLLDEPTSSVDAKNEVKIYENIFKSFKQKTILSTIHRLHLLSKFDRILVFKKGELVASGTLRGLLHSSPDFRSLWKKYREASKRKK